MLTMHLRMGVGQFSSAAASGLLVHHNALVLFINQEIKPEPLLIQMLMYPTLFAHGQCKRVLTMLGFYSSQTACVGGETATSRQRGQPYD